MGILSWFFSGLAASLLLRVIRRERPQFRREATICTLSAAAAGFAATALNFGGLDALDPRASLFTLFAGLAGAGFMRLRTRRSRPHAATR